MVWVNDEQVIEELKHISDVKEVNGVFGAHDILAKVESDQISTLRDTITRKIRKIDHVRSTLTLIVIEELV